MSERTELWENRCLRVDRLEEFNQPFAVLFFGQHICSARSRTAVRDVIQYAFKCRTCATVEVRCTCLQ